MAENTISKSDVPARTEDDGVPATRELSRYLVPAVDIYETGDALVLVADMPGVDSDGLDVRVEDGLLTVLGRSSHTSSGAASSVTRWAPCRIVPPA